MVSWAAIFTKRGFNFHYQGTVEQIGAAVVADWNVGKLITYFYTLFGIWALVFSISFLFLRRIEKNKEMGQVFSNLAVLGIALNVLVIFPFFSIPGQTLLKLILLSGLSLFLVFFIIFQSFFYYLQRISKTSLVITAIDFFIVFSLLFNFLDFNKWKLLGVLIIGVISSVTIQLTISTLRIKAKTLLNGLLAFLPVTLFLTSEISNNLIFRFQLNPFFMVVPFFVILVVGGFCILKGIFSNSLPTLFLSGIALLSVLQPLWIPVHADIFESANYSILISDFLNFGTLPLVGHFGGHMLQGVLEGIFYGLISGDKFGAIFSPWFSYISIPLATWGFYSITRSALRDEFLSLIVTLSFPIFWFIPSPLSFGFLVVLAALKVHKEGTYTGHFLLCLASLMACLMALDVGVSFVLATFFTIILFEKKNKIKKLAITVSAFLTFCLLVWVVLCFSQDASPFKVIRSFLRIVSSNPHWAYPTLGDPAVPMYSFFYLFLPVCVLVISGSLLTLRPRLSSSLLFLIILLAFAYFLNFQRTLVRHGVAEGWHSWRVLLWTAPLFLCFSLYYLSVLNKKILLTSITSILIIFNLIMGANTYQSAFLLPNLFSNLCSFSFSSYKTYKDNPVSYKGSKTRARFSNLDILSEAVDLDRVLNALLRKEEYYLDFSNKTFLYSLIGRRNIFYPSQIPAQINSKEGQREVIEKLENGKVPIVVLPKDNKYLNMYLDGIPHNIRHYIIISYIYHNYLPLISTARNILWARRDLYQDLSQRIKCKIQRQSQVLEIVIPKDLSILLGRDCKISSKDGKILVSSEKPDPQILNFEKLLPTKLQEPKPNLLTFHYKTNHGGVAQLFYASKDGLFTEEHSIKQEIKGTGKASFALPYSFEGKLRLDPPRGDFEILSITLENDIENFTPDQVLHRKEGLVYSLGHLPRLMAPAAEIVYKEGTPVHLVRNEDEIKGESKLSLTSTGGKLLVLSIHSEISEGKASLEIFSSSPANKSTFNFLIKGGKYFYAFWINADFAEAVAKDLNFRIIIPKNSTVKGAWLLNEDALL